jgi:hypothetical protein
MSEAQTWTEHEARLLNETREYLATYPLPGVEIDQVMLVGKHPDTVIRTDYWWQRRLRHLEIGVWAEPEKMLRGNYSSVVSAVRALIQEDVATRPDV